jgi:hypothetical protein
VSLKIVRRQTGINAHHGEGEVSPTVAEIPINRDGKAAGVQTAAAITGKNILRGVLALGATAAAKTATPKVPIASRVFRRVPARVSRIAGVSVYGPCKPWQSAFCSHPVLQVRRFAQVKNPNSRTDLYLDISND